MSASSDFYKVMDMYFDNVDELEEKSCNNKDEVQSYFDYNIETKKLNKDLKKNSFFYFFFV